jgi:hypothetical protein
VVSDRAKRCRSPDGHSIRPARLAAVFLGAGLWQALLAGAAFGQGVAEAVKPRANGDEFIKVRLDPGVSLRTLSERFLDDPDLWPVILRLNGFERINDLAEGQELLVPGNQVRLAATALDASLTEIQVANEAGAQLFAPILIRNAIEFRDQAVVENQNGVYAESIALSSRSIDRAGAARERSEAQRQIEAEARLNDRQGWVEGQKSSETGWSERELNAILNEREKLRTLSRSTAQVVFRDASRLRLNPNSQAVIQRMRVDPLKRREEAQISLVEGDFYALLATETQRNRLEVNLPNVDASIDSGSFWVSHDGTGAKFSNYDVKPVSITSGADTLVLGRNEGTFVRTGDTPRDKFDVLGRVDLLAPEDGAVLFSDTVALDWRASGKGGGYWLEIAYDTRFDRMADSQWGLAENRVEGLPLAPATYYWRVAALDEFGLPGQMSTVRKFEVRTDEVPPFLQLRTPQPDAILREAAVTISGETEPGAAVEVDGATADTDQEGRFFFTIEARDGRNEVEIVARDVAGNETARRLAFTYLRDEKRAIAYDTTIPRDGDGRFLSASRELSLSGTAAADARVAFAAASGAIRSETQSDAQGRFAANVPLAGAAERLTVSVTTRSGYAYEEVIEAAVLDRPPAIGLGEPLPQVTAEAMLALTIETEDSAAVTVNGAGGEPGDGAIRFVVELDQGPNLIEIVATNPVGLVTIEKRTVIFDTEMPELTGHEILVETREDRALVTMHIGARDASGLAMTAPFSIRGAAGEREGVLRYNRARRVYQGTVEMPHAADGDVFRVEIEIADIAGNVNRVELTR